MAPHNYKIIGSTNKPDFSDLPVRLSPIIQSVEDPSKIKIIDFCSSESDIVYDEDRSFVELMFQEGRYYRILEPIPVQENYWLVQFSPYELPEYLPKASVEFRSCVLGKRALHTAAYALISNQREHALDSVRYASMLLSGSTFARLAIIALFRPAASVSQLWFEELPLSDVDPQTIASAFNDAKRDPKLTPLVELIINDPIGRKYDLK